MALQTLPNLTVKKEWVEIAPGAQEVLVQCLSGAGALIAVGAAAPEAADSRGHQIQGSGPHSPVLSLGTLAGAKVFARAISSSAELAVTSRT